MIKDVVLWTYSGSMKIVYLSQFAKMIPHKVVRSPHIEVTMQKRAFWDHEVGREFFMEAPLMDFNFERVSHKLKTFYQITDMDKMRANHLNNGYSQFREQISDAAFKRIEEEFRVMVAKRQPTFFMKDLSMENVEKLSKEHSKQMGSDACGVQIQLSPYQKFFVIIDPDDLCFYQTMIHKHTISHPGLVTEFLGKLVDMRPEKWQMGRYENLTYLHELNAMQRYTAPTGGSDESGR